MSGETIPTGEAIELAYGYERPVALEARHLVLTGKTVRFVVSTAGSPGTPVIDITCSVTSPSTAVGTITGADAEVTVGDYTYGWVVDDRLILMGSASVVVSP